MAPTHHTDDALEKELEDYMSEMESLAAERRATPRRRVYRLVGMALLLIMLCSSRVTKTRMFPEDIDEKSTFKPVRTPPSNISTNDEKSASHSDENASMVQMEANGIVYNVTQQAAQQIESYRRGTGLLLNVHITHHGGTTVCSTIGRSPDAVGASPTFACGNVTPQDNVTDYPAGKPWARNETAKNIAIVRKYFHMISWEFGWPGQIPNPSLEVTEWENPNLLSVIVMKDPIRRLLAGSGWVRTNFPGIHKGNGTRDEWLEYANNRWFTNNYALRVLAGTKCCNGTNTDPQHLKNAKALVERFSIVLDIECLTEGLEALSALLNITLANSSRGKKSSHHAPSRERIGYDDVYEFLLEKNHLDIELYEWSKSLALLDCSKIRKGKNE